MRKTTSEQACQLLNMRFLWPIMRYLLIGLFLSTGQLSLAQMDGKQLFTMHCSACHQMQVVQGGPMLTEVASLYRGKPKAFIEWAHNPLPHKRKNLAQMPAMAHMPKEDLKKIYHHVMDVTKNIKPAQKKKEPVDRFPEKSTRRPQVQRIFMPKASPAAIAVALPNKWSYCFDASLCRMRYAWHGDFINGFSYWQGNGNGLSSIKGKIRLREDHSPLPFLKEPQFLGYDLKDRLPTFRYREGDITITERWEERLKGLRRTFTLDGAPNEITLTFPEVKGLSYLNETGVWDGTSLTISTTSPIVIDYRFSESK